MAADMMLRPSVIATAVTQMTVMIQLRVLIWVGH